MEKLLDQIPRPLLVVLILFLAIGFFMLSNPPHTICDTKKESIATKMSGILYATKVNNNKIPPKIIAAKESCRIGNSVGSCYEYFSILRNIANEIAGSRTECLAEVLEVNEIKRAFNDGIEVMARIAWGEEPPGKGLEKTGWFQENELVTFCRIRNIYLRAFGNEYWGEVARRIYPKLPGPIKRDRQGAIVEQKPAVKSISELEIWSQSIFSTRCENYN